MALSIIYDIMYATTTTTKETRSRGEREKKRAKQIIDKKIIFNKNKQF
jgi:hypothetical protein